MSDSDLDDLNNEDDQWSKIQRANVKPGMFVSGWEDPDDLVYEDQNPDASIDRKILWAVNENNIDIVQQCLNECPSCVNSKDDDGYTPLHRACYNDNYEIAQLLLKHGASVTETTEFGWTPLHSACNWSHAKCVALLLQHNANVNAQTDGDQTPLHLAASVSNCRATAMTLLLDRKIKAELKNNSHESAADIARRTGLTYPIFCMGRKAFTVDVGLID